MWVCSSCHHKQPGGVEVSVRYLDVSGHFTFCWHFPSQQQRCQYEYLMGYGHPVSLIPNGLRTAEWRISDTLCHSDLPDTVLSLAHEIRALLWGPYSRTPRDGTFGVAVGIFGRYTAHSMSEPSVVYAYEKDNVKLSMIRIIKINQSR